MNITDLLGYKNVSIQVTPADLREFALYIINQVKQDERVRAAAAAASEERLSLKEVCLRYGLSTTTLWRWANDNYLVPIKFGRKVYYFKSDIERLMSKEKGKITDESNDQQ